MAGNIKRRVTGERQVYGPAMLALKPSDRHWVMTYCDTGNGHAAERMTGPAAPSAVAARVRAHRKLQRQDISAAVLEESRRRLAFNLPQHSRVVEQLAAGEGTQEQGPVPYTVQLNAARHLMAVGGLHEVVKHEVEHKVEVVLTVAEQFAELIRLGKKPEEVIANLPADEKKQVLELVKKKDGSFG